MFEQTPKITPDNPYVTQESFVINGAQVDAIDIKPKNQKEEVPVLIAPGHSATKDSVRPGLDVLAQRGRRAISFDYPRKGGTIPELHNEEVEKWYEKRGQDYPDWSSEELRKAHTLLGLLEQKKIDKVDVIAYSEAAINVCIAAMLRPEKFIDRTIILYSPAGLIGKDTFFRLVKGVVSQPKRPESMLHIPVTEAETKNIKLMQRESGKYNKANRLRSLREGIAISKAQIEDMLLYLHEKGIRIIVIQGVDDTVFPMDRMQKIIKPISKKNGFVDGFLSVSGGHVEVLTHPEFFMNAIEKMLEKPKDEKK